MKKRKTGKERAMYAFGGTPEDGGLRKRVAVKPLDTATINNSNVDFSADPNLRFRNVFPNEGNPAPLPGNPAYLDFQKGLMNTYLTYPEAQTHGADIIYGSYTGGGVQGRDNPTQLDQILNNIEYMKNNSPASNNYKLKDSHYSIDGYGTKPKDTPMVAALGTGASGVEDGLGGYGSLISMIPSVANSVINMAEHNPNAYSDQPIMNASTIRGMKTPYSFAYGGEAGDEEQMQQLQDMADEQGISIEELIAQLQSQQDDSDMDMGDNEQLEDPIPDDTEEEEPDNVGETFGGEFAYGGTARRVPIEVEGGEVLQSPTGKVKEANGPSHANGGVDVNVIPGTKVYSDRIKVDGKTMAERKLKRERSEKRIEKLKLKHEYDPLVNNSLQRTVQVNKAEEAEDMQLQEALKDIEDKKKYPYGGKIPYANAVNGEFDPLAGTGLSDIPLYNTQQVPFRQGYMAGVDPITSASLRKPFNTNIPMPKAGVNYPARQPVPDVETPNGSPFTTGDYVGMAGNLFNAIAPIINTNNAAAATRPTINRYRGYGHDAIAANDAAQGMANTLGSEALTDIDTSANSAIERGRNSASGIGTARALDIATTIGANKAKIGARDATTKQLIGLVNMRGQLTNRRDTMEMAGQERADIENDAKTDNYFSNKAANLVNFGTNIEGLGRNLNISKQNQTDSNLIASMAKNNIKVGADGKISNKYMQPEVVQRYLDLGYTIDEDGKLVRPRKRK